MAIRKVLIVCFDGVQSLDVTGPLEAFTGANTARAAQGLGPAYTITTASLGGQPVRTSSGLLIVPETDLDCVEDPDVLLVPGGLGGAQRDPRLVAWVRENAARARQIVSVCTGAFLLAEAGLLAGCRVTTHWAHCAALAERFPDVQVLTEPIFVQDGLISTSAGVTAGIDLALAIVEDHLGRDTALAVARHLVVFLRRPGGQAQFSVQLATQMAQREPVREVQQWVAEHPNSDLSVEALAQRASLSPRQFTRAFSAEVGMPPGRYVDRIRLEAARRQLEDTNHSIEEIADDCGYGTTEAMRRAFLRIVGVAPAEYRRRFQPSFVPSLGES
ncbi:GlxA family transcriptional regulator [Nocardia sp. NPDC051756]|uniref:GlxA family transcriptional regulator n=1 Tax=Nocardia sp. NPDC051756 TaxID=3154751 RepID=UPI0034161EBD